MDHSHGHPQPELYSVSKDLPMEALLKDSEEIFRYVSEYSPLPLAIIDEKGNYEYINPMFTEVFGYTRADVPTGKDWIERAYPDPRYRRKVINAWKQDLALYGKGKLRPRTFTVTCKDGRHREILFRPVLMDNNKHLIIYEDITERRQAEKSIEEKNMMLAILNRYTTEQADVQTYKDLVKTAARQLIDYTGSLFVAFNEYDPLKKTLLTKHIESEQKIINTAVRLAGKGILKVETPFSEEVYKEVTGRVVGFRSTLNEITQGVIPEKVSAAVQKATGINLYVYLAHVVEGRLYGTSILGFKSEDEAPLFEFLESYAYITAISFRRLQAEEKIRYMGFHDQLTGLYNRYYLTEELNRLDTARQLPLSVIMADLNGLKLINDTYGHEKGDEMLKKAAEVLKASCRQEDIVARWGGDEFIVLLPQTSLNEARLLCARIESNCRSAQQREAPLSIALGLAGKTRKNKKLSAVLREAEDNMYKQKLTESRSVKNAVLKDFLKILAEKSYETEAHTRRMQRVARLIGVRLNLADAELRRLELLITLHDIGKINIAEEILVKKGPLNNEEWAVIMRHPETGFRIARATEDFAHVADDILAHHERWDGSGYPRGLKGKEIPLLARIVAIADAYEVMSNGRPYKKALSKNEIEAEFKQCSGSQFDPELTGHFLEILKEDITG